MKAAPPPRSPDAAPGDVISLSRYRAQIGLGGRRRNLRALLAAGDAPEQIRALPGDELYALVREIGARDAGELLVHATAEQVQTCLDFDLWDRDVVAPARAAEWLEVLAGMPYEKLGEWLRGLDVELVGLLLRRTTRIYDLSRQDPPEEPEGTLYETPDRMFVIDILGKSHEGETPVMIRLLENLYRADKDFARHLLVALESELVSELEDTAHRWRSGRMADLGFADYHEALEVYRELDPATVRLGEMRPGTRLRPVEVGGGASPPRPRPSAALAEWVADARGPFARGVGRLLADESSEVQFALVTLGNRVLAADRVQPGDEAAIRPVMERVAATLDLAVDFLARGDGDREEQAVRSVPVVRLFRLGVSLLGKLRAAAAALGRRGPFAAVGREASLFEPEDAAVLAAIDRVRPLYPRVLDDPPRGGQRPFSSMTDLARATAAVERAGAAMAMLVGLGVTAEALATETLGPLVDDDEAGLDAGRIARTALVARLLGRPPGRLQPLSRQDVADFKKLMKPGPEGPVLNEDAHQDAVALLGAATPAALRAGAAAGAVARRWVAALAPLESVLVRRERKGPMAKPAAGPEPKPAAGTAARAAESPPKPMPPPAARPAPKPAAKPARKPAPRPTPKRKPTPRPVIETARKPTPRPPKRKPTPRPVIKTARKPRPRPARKASRRPGGRRSKK